MKTKTILFAILMTFSISMFGQEIKDSVSQKLTIHERWEQNEEKNHWQIGVRLGGVASDMLYTDPSYKNYKHNPYARGTIGLWFERDIIAGFSIRPEFAFIGRGVLLSRDNLYYGLMARYFDIRLNLRYTFLRDKKVQPYVFVTPSSNVVMNGSLNLYESDIDAAYRIELTNGNIARVSASLMAGAGVNFPITIDDFTFNLGAEMGYNFGYTNTYSSAERQNKITPVNKYYDKILGSRLNSNFELALNVGIPLNSFKHHERVTTPKEKKESYFDRMARERAERKEAERIKAEQQAELLRLLQEQQSIKTDSYNQELALFNQNLAPQNRVGDGIKMYVVPNAALAISDNGDEEMNLTLEFAYETQPATTQTLTYNKNTDDYPAGAYLPTQSKACKTTLAFIKEQLSGEMKKYLTPGTKVTIKITGETDGSAIRNAIPYKGEFGDFNHELIYLNDNIDDISVTKKSGITSNAQLGFLRTQGVKQYIETYIDELQQTQNTYQIYAVERKEKGSQYRRISVEFTIHNAYQQELKRVRKESALASGMTAEQYQQECQKEEEKKNRVPDVDSNIPKNNQVRENTYALIIANEHYKDIVGVVPFAENDGNIFRQYCISTLGIPERQIRLITDATKNEIIDGLEWIENIAQARNGKTNIIVYYAGHGIPISEATYLLPIDGNPEKTNQLIALNDIYNQLGNMPAETVTCFLDACFSGTRRNGQPIAQGGRGASITPKLNPIHGKLVIFSAADASQTAYPYSEQKHGLFTYYLLKALQENKGKINYENLIAYLTEKVSIEASLQNRKQTPNLQYSETIEDQWQKWSLY